MQHLHMLIEEFEEEIRRKKRRKKIILLIITFIWLGFLTILLYNRFFSDNIIIQEKEPEKKEEIVIFYPDKGLKFKKMTLKLQKNMQEKERVDLAIKTLKELKTLPEALVLYEVGSDERGIIYANFSKHLVEETKESKREIAAVFSIVNTLITNIQNAKAVQFLIEGEPVYTLNGIIYIYKPIFFNDNLVED
ncbi:MAG: GerMN domain-containing protein [Syntrophorhabdaceae bacterium]|nr:GerMN domain-containing protein [Syntrophorhabdaceae bacterium]